MGLTSCNPCGCISGNIENGKFKQDVETLLCSVLDALVIGGNSWTPSSQTALSNTKTQIKSGAGTFGGYVSMNNPNATVVYIQVWDVVLASITVGTTAPTYTLSIPAGATANVELSNGIKHLNAICVAATTTPTGSSAPASAVVCSFLYT